MKREGSYDCCFARNLSSDEEGRFLWLYWRKCTINNTVWLEKKKNKTEESFVFHVKIRDFSSLLLLVGGIASAVSALLIEEEREMS